MKGKKELIQEKENYKKVRKEQEDIRLMNCKLINDKMDDILHTLLRKNAILTFDNLSEIPLNETYSLNEKINIVKIKETSKNVVFETYMEPGASFSLHSHDCYEVVEVVEGHLIDSQRGKDIYQPGDQLIYGMFEKHEPKAQIRSKYIVSFIK